jgi:hypothetical protein
MGGSQGRLAGHGEQVAASLFVALAETKDCSAGTIAEHQVWKLKVHKVRDTAAGS